MARQHRIVEGETFGAPVPGGWPDKGPFEVLMRKLQRRRRRDETSREKDEPASDS